MTGDTGQHRTAIVDFADNEGPDECQQAQHQGGKHHRTLRTSRRVAKHDRTVAAMCAGLVNQLLGVV